MHKIPMQFKEGRAVNYEVQFDPLLIRATQRDNPQKCWQLNLTKQNYLQKLPTLKKTTSFEILEKTIAEMFEGKVCSTFVEDTGLDYLRVVCDSDLIRNLFGEIKLDLKSNDLLRDEVPRAGITAPRGVSSYDRRSLALDNRYPQKWGASPRYSLALERETLPNDTFSTTPRDTFSTTPRDTFSSSKDTFSTDRTGLDQNWASTTPNRTGFTSTQDRRSFAMDKGNFERDWDTTSPRRESANFERGAAPITTSSSSIDRSNLGRDTFSTDRSNVVEREWESPKSTGFESDRDISEDDEYEEVEEDQNRRGGDGVGNREIWEMRNKMQKLENQNEDLRRMVLDYRRKGGEVGTDFDAITTTTTQTTKSYPKLTLFFFLFFGVIAAAYLVSRLL